ncbi:MULTISPECIES: acyl-CoA dehydrogenase family protein [unclassified Variovorax]|uniref:acyl-CoA dehydrogenase family protein n=1 Tax=unclassified Variovorax TaxID=663243 RepID=UPI0025779627|nr:MULTISPECIES: acyl-CoA dehydrogenase family protein [unclassified Variovorax]MDM0087610.1 acyl-CoA dehydrogenase family protein [Variovorax sp. J22G40]MDM0144133.1 acyl-CoA dehydrogenase family protein [Variovorax sp. J2P1-31]
MGHSDSLPLARISDELLASLRDEFAATAAEHDQQASFPHANFERLGALDLLALTVPAAHGGLGGGLADAARVVGAVGGGEASTGLLLAMNYLMHHTLGRNPPAGYEAIARAAVEGRGVLNALQAEPDLGSAIRGGLPGTVATPQPDGSWRLSGRKAYATGSPIVRWWLVLARTGSDDAPCVGTVLVPGDAPGLSVVPTWNHAGLRATASHEVRLDEVAVPAGHALGFHPPGAPEGQARRAVVEVWNGVLIAALYDGIARAGSDWLRRFLHERVPSNLGAPLATVPRLQGIVGEIQTLLLVNRTLIDDAARRADAAATPDPLHAQQVKHLVTGNAVRILELALSATGNHGLDRANPLERHYRDALCGRVHAPQADTVLLNAGKAALGF